MTTFFNAAFLRDLHRQQYRYCSTYGLTYKMQMATVEVQLSVITNSGGSELKVEVVLLP